MQLADGVHIQWIGDEAVALNEETGLLHYLNSTAAVILATVLEHGESEATILLSKAYGDERAMARDMSAVLDVLRDKGLLVESQH
jgi:hypothetical protein